MSPSLRLCWGLFCLCAPSVAWADNLLAGRAPSQSTGVTAPHKLSDQIVEPDGADWLSPGASTLQPGAFVEWDLGQRLALGHLALQADNNDEYVLSVSDDGAQWKEVWRAPPVADPGLQTRERALDEVSARFLRLTPLGGDGRYSISEVELLSRGTQGSLLLRAKWIPRAPLDVAWAWAVLGAAVLLAATGQRVAAGRQQALLIAAGLGLLLLLKLTFENPLDAARLAWLRACLATIAFLAVLREGLWPVRHPSYPQVTLGMLGLTGVLGALCFFNLGQPQFFDAGKRERTFLHHYDMRTYFPIAKYFTQLRFDGVYAASTHVVAEERGVAALGHLPLRDLRTHDIGTVAQLAPHLAEVKARFTPERWADFVKDMGYFRHAMGEGGFLGSMNDHGGNATPVWFLAARLLFQFLPASDGTLWLGVVLDVALLLLAFWALWKAWGPRTALVAMTVFGAMDFYLFGSNWFGAALRHDWLSLWALGLCALKKERWGWAGALLAWSALIRAFPALTLLTLSIPPMWAAAQALRSGTFSWASWSKEHWPFIGVVKGAALASAVLVGLSLLVFGWQAWPEWFAKVALLDRDPHVNNLAVRTWVTNTRGQWLLVLAVLGAESAQGVGWKGRASWLILLAMCAASFFTTLTPDLGAHFRQDTWVLLTALAALVAVQLALPGHFSRAGAPKGMVQAER